MSVPIDVLATLKDAEMAARTIGANRAADEFGEIHGAFAELIEAAKAAREWIIEVGGHKGIQNAGTLVRLNSAIAKAGGAP